MPMKLRYLLLPLLLTLSACASAPDDKYPYSPQFVTIEEVGERALASPPAVDSATYKHEIDSIIARQKKLTDADKKTIMAEDHIEPAMLINPVLGAQYTAQSNPALFTLLQHSASDSWRVADAIQDYWHRDRPWIADKRIHLYTKPIERPSYPSGHTTTNTVWAYELSELFPEKHDALFARATQIGQHRIDGGVHFPHDVEGGQKLAAILFEKMNKKPEFQKELAAAKTELGIPNETVMPSPMAGMPMMLPRGEVPGYSAN